MIPYWNFDGPGVLHLHQYANQLCDFGCPVMVLMPSLQSSAARLQEPPRYRLIDVGDFPDAKLSPSVNKELQSFAPDLIHGWTPRSFVAKMALQAHRISGAPIVIHHEDEEDYLARNYAKAQGSLSVDDAKLFELVYARYTDPREFARIAEGLNVHNLDHALRAHLLIQWEALDPFYSPLVEKLAAGFTAIIQEALNQLRCRWRAPCHLLLPGIQLDRFGPHIEPHPARREKHLEEKIIFLYGGSIHEHGDFQDLLKAMPEIIQRHPDVVLYQVGAIHIGERSVGELVEKLGLKDHVFFHGTAPHHEMPSLLAMADILVCPGRDTRFNRFRLPSKVPEYLAAGKPVATFACGVGELLTDGVDAVKFYDGTAQELAEVLNRLLENRDSWPEMGQKGRARACELFDVRTNTAALIDFYRGLCPSGCRVHEESHGKSSVLTERSDNGICPGDEDYLNPVLSRDFATVKEVPSPDNYNSMPGPGAVQYSRGGKRILILSTDPILHALSGLGIRYWEIAHRLAVEFEVVLGSLDRLERKSESVELFCFKSSDHRIIRSQIQRSDVVITLGLMLDRFPEIKRSDRPLVVDLCWPFMLEAMEWTLGNGGTIPQSQYALKINNLYLAQLLQRGDFFLCANLYQKLFWAGLLYSLGRIDAETYTASRNLDHLLGIVPIGLSENPPERRAPVFRGKRPGVQEDDFLLLWGGTTYNWFDPETLFHALHDARKANPRIKLFFGGRAKHPGMPRLLAYERCKNLADEMGETDRGIFFASNDELIPYDRYGSFLLEFDVGVNSHYNTLETALANRFRFLSYIWAELPIISTEGDFMSREFESHGFAVTVPAGAVSKWRDVMLQMAEDPAMLNRMRKKMALYRPRLHWNTVVEPLRSFCRNPYLTHRSTEPGQTQFPSVLTPGSHGLLWRIAGRFPGLRVFVIRHPRLKDFLKRIIMRHA